DNEQEEVDPNVAEREVESDVEEDSQDDEDEFQDDAELNIYGTWRTQSEGCHVRWQRVRDPIHDRDCLPIHVCVQVRAGTASSSTPVVPATGTASLSTIRAVPPSSSSSPQEVESQHPAAEEGPQLPGQQPCWISGGKIDPSPASRYITTLVHAHIPGPVDAWRDFPVPVRD
ncbi:hypothetical protein Taro_037721, partial [Colocasia esculenta]|nr:hypothetical protein [Colocasia esculenta]